MFVSIRDLRKSTLRNSERALDVSASDELGRMLLDRLKQLDLHPKTSSEATSLLALLIKGGPTSVTDTLFAQALETTDPAARKYLRESLTRGWVWDPHLRSSVLVEDLRTLPNYLQLLSSTDPDERMRLLEEIIQIARSVFPEHGYFFVNFLEGLSRSINSTESESRVIGEAQRPPVGGKRTQDFAVRTLSAIFEDLSLWPLQHQWNFIRFLRGDLREPTRFLRDHFVWVGPERVRRMFLQLPTEMRAGFLDLCMSKVDGLLGSDTKGKWAGHIVKHLLSQGDPLVREVAGEILEALLHALRVTGDAPFQSFVLSYLLAIPPSNHSSVGEIHPDIYNAFMNRLGPLEKAMLPYLLEQTGPVVIQKRTATPAE